MTDNRPISKHAERGILGTILLLFAAVSTVGITWGLPSRSIDKYLFGDDPPWSGEKIYRLAGAAEKMTPERAARRGADVDVDPLDRSTDEPILLTGTEEDVAGIYLRYRLYTYQPDEMITMMALAGMNPHKLDLDPRLYQYGGLFIYPVGALIGACGFAGLIDVRSDVVHYLDKPDEFGKFYIVARAYSAAWGLIGVIVVFAIARRLGGSRAGLLAALLFTLMPVVVCMAHEGKPHLPGTVLMLMAVLFAMRHMSATAARFSSRGAAATDGTNTHVESPRGLKPATQDGGQPHPGKRDWWLMCICCGAALGMVLSSWPIFVLIPLVAWRAGGFNLRGPTVTNEAVVNRFTRATRAVVGIAVATGVYLVTNPYLLINAFVNRDVLRSNFGNSLAMYEMARVGEGFVHVLGLTMEGATLPVLFLGVTAIIVAILRKNGSVLPLTVPAAVFFLQFVLIGAGKPAEYGRFGIFTNTALAIGTACLLPGRWTSLREIVNWVPAVFIALWVALFGGLYLSNFRTDTTLRGSRTRLATFCRLENGDPATGEPGLQIALIAEPAPYGCPPVNFARTRVLLYRSRERFRRFVHNGDTLYLEPIDRGDSLRTFNEYFRQQPPHVLPDGIAVVVGGGRRSSWRERLETPISWANKPFLLFGPSARVLAEDNH